MGIALQKRLLTTKFENSVHEMMINVMLANTFLRMRLDEAFEDTDLTFPQYNLLRILNGAFPNGYSRGEISRRMIDRAPDMTRTCGAAALNADGGEPRDGSRRMSVLSSGTAATSDAMLALALFARSPSPPDFARKSLTTTTRPPPKKEMVPTAPMICWSVTSLPSSQEVFSPV